MPEATRPNTITCARCGTEKKVGRTGPIPTYCSANCRARVKDERAREDGRYERYLAEARQRTVERRAANARPCPYCGTAMTHPRRIQCGSTDCKRRYWADRMRDWNREYKERTGQWYHRNYAEQAREYSRRRYQERPHWRVLHPEQAALSDARRRMRMLEGRSNEVFTPLDVHTRDDWSCQLCGSSIDQTIAWPHPKSPSIDHIIPLSRGGAHALNNVQSAHLGCNSSKGDKDMVDAVLMLAGQAAPR